MANIQTILDGPRNVVIKITGNTTEAALTIVDVSALDPACSRIKIKRMSYDIAGFGLELLWGATAAKNIMYLSSGPGQELCFESFGGLINDAGAGVTGDILLTVTGTPGAYTLILELVKTTTINYHG